MAQAVEIPLRVRLLPFGKGLAGLLTGEMHNFRDPASPLTLGLADHKRSGAICYVIYDSCSEDLPHLPTLIRRVKVRRRNLLEPRSISRFSRFARHTLSVDQKRLQELEPAAFFRH